jgi:flagellar basal-body rod protein FlgB
MIRQLLATTNAPLLKQVARFTERRQEVLAGNIANVDTPGFRMQDLPVAQFRTALRQAVDRLQSPVTASQNSAQSLASPAVPITATASVADLFPDTLFQPVSPLEQPGVTFQDGANRSIEHQFLEMTKNTLLQQFALQVLQGQYDQLQTVISERVA